MSQAKIFEENILGGGARGGNQQFVGERAKKKKLIKGNQGGTREMGGETKESCPQSFTVFRRPEFGSLGIKVGLLDESYE